MDIFYLYDAILILFLNYFQHSWIGQNICNSIFRIKLWNCHDLIEHNMSRTNNSIETITIQLPQL